MTKTDSQEALETQAAFPLADLHPDTPSPIETLVHLLQGGGDYVLADPGIAGYGRPMLDRISGAALRQSEQCMEQMRCLLSLLYAHLNVESPDIARDTRTYAVKRIYGLLSDHERWRALADNASFYRDHPEVARRVATTSRRA